ncbi:DMT family transporter [Glaciimonas immobilis]|uniref:Drug/metabolite transporter (DMT)-like permease n=1 Tax=Glaciimonas immobilis TaxID=728004 RepID=A0A840RVB3_9BURK|nr:DMT family transporter [Glaciimonas immobilis]KAF3996524.1 DMT family transporter [Glaciimonas immobilis]MBB5201112.1 drug/metabolite transporter (DMT)-like permease [Glaciimonas immobilis]
MSSTRLTLLTLFAMLSFAGNSVLCRLALKQTSIDATSFTAIRLVSGALILTLLVLYRRRSASGTAERHTAHRAIGGSWSSACALFVYAAGFSFAYVSLPTGTGALLLFGAVQATMILGGLWSGERLSARQITGFLLALVGLIVFMLPGLSAPPLPGALLMLSAGFAWGIYSLRGRGVANASNATAGNFLRAALLSIMLSAVLLAQQKLDEWGILYAVLSGAIASGIGYTVWYAALRGLTATRAASVQLSVPVIAALAGVLFLHEPITMRLLLASVVILGGVGLVVVNKRSTCDSVNAEGKNGACHNV